MHHLQEMIICTNMHGLRHDLLHLATLGKAKINWYIRFSIVPAWRSGSAADC
tara:strand:+ start:441 stop:596 length:156 start_codon:yes stop_codon:yes gene_type:complete